MLGSDKACVLPHSCVLATAVGLQPVFIEP